MAYEDVPGPANLTTLLDQLGDSFLLTDRAGVIQYVNDAFESMTGYSRADVVGQTPRVLRSGKHPEQVYKDLWDTILAGKVFRFIFTNRKKDGTLYEEGTMISPLFDAQGRITHYASMGRAIRESRQTYDLFTLLADSSPIGVYLLRDGKFFYLNNEFERRTGYSAADLIGKEWWHLVLEEDRDHVREAAAAMLRGEQALPFEYRIFSKSGEVRWIMETVRSVDFHGGRSTAGTFAAGNFVDITTRRQTEQKLKHALSLYTATVESTADGICVLDSHGEIVAFNHKWLEMWRLPASPTGEVDDAEVKRIMMTRLQDPKTMAGVITQVVAHPEIEMSATLELKDGRVLELYSKPQLIEEAIVGRVWSFRDITERRHFETQLMHMASHDPLTGLLNRRGFHEMAEPITASTSSQNALLMLDLDNFKDVNDSLGHTAGDEILIQVSAMLEAALPGHLVARFGGDEFAVLLRDVSNAEGREAAERVLTALSSANFQAGGVSVVCTASAGLAFAPPSGATIGDLVSFADLAMYEAKARGRDRYTVYSQRLRSRGKVQFNRDWQNELRDAIRSDDLRIYAQPVADLANGTAALHELVIRLPSVHGLPLVSRDVPAVAERIGLGKHLDRWLVGQAAAVVADMSKEGRRATLVLTLSSRALRDAEVVESLSFLLRSCASRGNVIVLRLTEASIAATGQFSRVVETLRALGCRFSLDDLSASRSLFRHLKQLPVDYLRIDGSIVKDVTISDASCEVLRGLVQIARGLGIQTIAESANDEATARALRSLGVDYALGNHFGRARSVKTIGDGASQVAA